MISQAERAQLREMQDLIAQVVAVDDFTPEEMARLYPGTTKVTQ